MIYLDFALFLHNAVIKRRSLKPNFLDWAFYDHAVAIRWTNERREKFTVRIWKRNWKSGKIADLCTIVENFRLLNSKRETPR